MRMSGMLFELHSIDSFCFITFHISPNNFQLFLGAFLKQGELRITHECEGVNASSDALSF